jgi:hypothetical protein
MKSFIQFLEPLNKWLWSFLCKRHLILFCSSDAPDMPDPIDPGKATGEYLFGKRFAKDYEGITDPRLQERLIAAESAYRPRYTALELQDIATMAYGIEAGTPNQERLRLEAELAGLQAAAEVDATIDYAALEESLKRQYSSAAGPMKATRGRGGQGSRTRYKSAQGSYVESGIESAKLAAQLSDKERAAKIAQLEAQIEQMPETLEGQKGLFQMLEDQSRMAGDLQREQLGLQRESDVAALREYAPQVVEAYREADPRSAALADLAQQQAETLYAEAEGELSPERRRIAEQAARQASLARGRIGDESSIAAEILGREQFKSGLRAEARQAGAGAFGQQRQMAGDVGMTILGRPSAAIGLGGQMLGQAQAGAAGPMGPQLFDPNVGINMAMQQRSQDINLMGAQAQADASRSAGLMGGLGAIGGGLLGNTSLFCWVAREVYGVDNPKWLQFREWMLEDSPSWFRSLYIKYGERFAKFISNKPLLKTIIRKWMNTRIK